MLKWFSTRRNLSENVITDDPLATIATYPKSNQVYAVSRVNPLFVEDENCDDVQSKEEKPPKKRRVEDEAEEEFKEGENSGSSGYESHRSSRSSSGDEESNAGRTLGGSGLSTIHEGRTESVPEPVWPDLYKITRKPQPLPIFKGDPTEMPPQPQPLHNLHQNMVYGSLPSRSRLPSSSSSNIYEKINGSTSSGSESKASSSHYEWIDERGLDFTLDKDQAEKLIKRLKTRKQQMCLCRFVTSAVGLILFILSVITVSLLLTNGKRIFGSL